MGGNIPEFHVSRKMLCAAVAVFLAALQFQHRRNPVGTGKGLGYSNDQICHFDQLYQNLRHVIVKGNHQSLGQQSAFYLNCANSNQNHHR